MKRRAAVAEASAYVITINGDVRAERALHVSVSAIFRLAFHVRLVIKKMHFSFSSNISPY
jgi:hypothetical protein